LKLCAVVAFTLIGICTAANFLVDPLQFYRRAGYPPLLRTEARYQNPGLAKNYDYDAVIIGTSVSLGFDPVQIRERLGMRVLNLAMPGASAHEQFLLLQVALRSGRVRHVIWDINYEFIRGTPAWVSDYDGAFPGYLYDTNAWNEVPHYLLNLDTAKDTLRILWRRYTPRAVESLTQTQERERGRNRVLVHWEKSRAGNIFTREPGAFAPAHLRASFQANFPTLIRAHPQVHFDLYFPPISFVHYAMLRTDLPSAFDDFFRWRLDVKHQLAALPNTRLFDFQGVPGIVMDLSRYSDAVHFDAATHREIVEAIANRQYLATDEMLAATEALLRREATMDWPRRH